MTTDAQEAGAPRDQYGLTESERLETVYEIMHAHWRGEHDWDTPDPYGCTICHVVIALYREVILTAERAKYAALRESVGRAEFIIGGLGGQSSPRRIMRMADEAGDILRAALAALESE